METLTLAAMVKVLYPGAREESEVSRAALSAICKLKTWANLNGVHVSNLRDEALSKMFITYWEQYTRKVVLCDGTSVDLPRTASELLELNLNDSRDFADRASELTYLITGEELSQEEYDRETYKYFFLGLFGRVAKEVKYSINLLFSKFFGTERPTPIMGTLGMSLFPRRLTLCFKRMCDKHSSRTLDKSSIIYTVFQGWKKGLLPLRPDAIDQSLLDHASALGTQKSLSQELQDSIEKTLEEAFGTLPSMVQKLICGQTEDEFWRSDNTLSTKSTTEMSMSGLGQIGLAMVIDRWEHKHSVQELKAGLARELRWHPDTVLCGESLIGFEFIGPNYVGPVYETVRLFDEEIKEILLRVRDLVASCQPSIVLEPLKARIITKPNSGCYLGMLPLQKLMHGYLKKYPEFQLIGNGAVTEEMIWSISKGWTVGRAWNSGDYSGATDNLKGEISAFIMRWVLKNTMVLNPRAYTMIMESFTQCRVDYIKPVLSEDPWAEHYSEWKSSDRSILQKNGQLMGHVLSFPVLCMANYCAFVESYRRSRTIRPPVLVNGDDILFHCTQSEYDTWDQTVRDFGFFPSQGKNLFSDKVCQINSVLFKMSTANIGDDQYFLRSVDAVPYCNFGILTNRGKGRGVARSGYPEDLEETELARMPVIGKCMEYLEYLPNAQPSRAQDILRVNHPYLNGLGVFDWIHPGDGFYPNTFDGVGGRRHARDAGLGSRHISQLKGVLGEQFILNKFNKLKKKSLVTGAYRVELPAEPYRMPYRNLPISQTRFVSDSLFVQDFTTEWDDDGNEIVVPMEIEIYESDAEYLARHSALTSLPLKYSMLEPESVLVY